jgi:FHS family Na+ dependent glucose MFS transporter 1
MAGAILGPTLPSLTQQTRSHLSEVSFLFTAVSVGYLSGSLLGGRLYDRVSGNPVMATGLLIMASMLALTPFLPQLWLLMLVIALLGTAQGTVDVGGNTLLVWVHGRSVGPYMNGLHFFWGLGALISPIIVGLVLQASGEVSWAFWIMALMTVPIAIRLLRLASPKLRPGSQTHSETYQASATDDRPRRARERSVVLLVTLLLFLFVGAEAGFGGWIYSYTLALGLGSTATAAYLTSAYWGALTFGRLLAVPIAGRVRPRWILLADACGCLASIGVLFLWPQSRLATWVATIGMGLFMASIFPTAITLAERRIPITGRTTGWFLVGASLGGMTLPMLMGQLFDSVSPQSAMVLLAMYLVAALIALITLLFGSERRLSNYSSL